MSAILVVSLIEADPLTTFTRYVEGREGSGTLPSLTSYVFSKGGLVELPPTPSNSIITAQFEDLVGYYTIRWNKNDDEIRLETDRDYNQNIVRCKAVKNTVSLQANNKLSVVSGRTLSDFTMLAPMLKVSTSEWSNILIDLITTADTS